jgi:hypothetical protein
VITVKSALESGLAKGISMSYTYGASAEIDNNTTGIPSAVAVASAADVIVLVIGDTKATCGEMVDRSSLELPGTVHLGSCSS